jgi:hypothetical protein
MIGVEDPMPPRLRRLYATFSVTFFLISALPIFRELSRRRDIWWTPFSMLVPLADSKDRAEVYVRREPLAALIQAGRLRMEDNGRSSVLATSDIGFRFNNWDRVRGEHIGLLLVCAAMCGVSALMFLLVLTGRLTYRGEEVRS